MGCRHSVPVHRSILVRLLATSTLVAVCAVTGTAWLAVKTTTQAIARQQGRSLADDKAVYEELRGFAATHRSWDGAGSLLRELGTRTGQRVALYTEDRRLIAESEPAPLTTDTPTSVVDPLRADGAREIDPRAVGPYLLPDGERREVSERAAAVSCFTGMFIRVETSVRPSGRTDLRLSDNFTGAVTEQCALPALRTPTATERAALSDLTDRVLGCIGGDVARLRTEVTLSIDFTVDYFYSSDLRTYTDEDVADCLAQAREEQLRPYTAPPALLFITEPATDNPPEVFSLTRDNLVRVALVSGAVLAVTVAFSVLAGLRVVRPLRALTEAVGAPLASGPVPVTGRDEIGRLATVLNDLTARRDRAERQRKEMINDIAHELRNPMTNIRSWLEAAEDGITPTDARLLALLLDETSQLSRILDDLRDLAAADAGTLRIHPEPIRLGDVLGPAADAHRGAADHGGVRLRTGFDPDLPIVADPVRMRQVAGNLLSNAIRHTPPGGTVALQAGAVGTDLVITVTDTGTGIAPADLPHIFDRFWRADPSRRRGTGGSGLGLAIVRDLVGAHQGSVDAVSTLGTGTTVTVRIPTRTA